MMYIKMKGKQNKQQFPQLSIKNNILTNNQHIIQYLVNLSGVQTQKVYNKIGFLGKGGFASCYVTQLVGSNRLMATKIIQKNSLKLTRSRLRLINQIKIHKTFNHPNIVQFIHYFQDYNNVYIMLELCSNQTLNQLLEQRGTLTLQQVQSFIYGICNGLKYLHGKKYIHRDLKLSNIFLNQKYQVKIGDFGLTSQLEFIKENKRTVCGTPNYIAPEVLEGTGYYFEVDIWAVGIIIYHLLYGFPPFQSQNTPQIYGKIKNCQYSFPKVAGVPPQAISLIKSILVLQPQKRPSLNQILNSSFMKLGKGIPLQLPKICYSRPPTKQQIQQMPLLNMKDNILKQPIKLKNNYTTNDIKQNKQQKLIINKTISLDYNVMVNNQIQSKIKWKQILKQNVQKCNYQQCAAPQKEEINQNGFQNIIDFQQIDDKAFYFCTGKYVIGTFQKDRQICFAHISNFQKSIQQINQIKLYNNLFSEQGQIPYINYKYRSILSIKAKQQIKKVLKNPLNIRKQRQHYQTIPNQKLIFITRINQHKDMIMLKLSNKNIQTIYQQTKDGFLYQFTSGKLYYYQNLFTFIPNQLDINNVKQSIKNYIKYSIKCNKITNIQTCISVINSNNYIKISIIKLKHIYGIINQVQNKMIKFAKNRNSQ